MGSNDRNETQEKNIEMLSYSSKEETERSKKLRFTVLDFFLLVVVLLCAVGIIFRAAIAEFFTGSAATDPITLSFKIEGLDKKAYDSFAREFPVALEGELLGQITSHSAETYVVTMESEDGNGHVVYVQGGDPEHVTVRGKLTVNGRYTENGIMVGEDCLLNVGKILKVSASTLSLTVIITEIPRK